MKKAACAGWWIVKPVLYTVVYTCVIPNNKKLFSTNFPLLLKPSFFSCFRQLWRPHLEDRCSPKAHSLPLTLALSPLPRIHCDTLSSLSLPRLFPSLPFLFGKHESWANSLSLSPSHPSQTTHIRKRLAVPEAEPPAVYRERAIDVKDGLWLTVLAQYQLHRCQSHKLPLCVEERVWERFGLIWCFSLPHLPKQNAYSLHLKLAFSKCFVCFN